MNENNTDLQIGVSSKEVWILKVKLTLLGFNSISLQPLPSTSLISNTALSDYVGFAALGNHVEFFDRQTEKAVRKFQQQFDLPVNGIVNSLTNKKLDRALDESDHYVVMGVVFDKEGRPRAKAPVIGRDRDVGGNSDLGHAISDESGRFVLAYKTDQFIDAEKSTADLLLSIKGDNSYNPDIIFDAGHCEYIDLIPEGASFTERSEYENLLIAIAPLLTKVKVSNAPQAGILEKLDHVVGNSENKKKTQKENDLLFLEKESGVPESQFRALVDALKLMKAIIEDFSPAFAYGLIRQHMSPVLNDLLERRKVAIENALNKAFEANIIPKYLQGESQSFLKALNQLAIEHFMRETDTKEDSSLGDVLRLAKISKKLQQQYVRAVFEYDDDPDKFEQLLIDKYDFTPAQLLKLTPTLELSRFASGHAPMIEKLQTQLGSGFAKKLPELTKLELGDYKKLVKGPAGSGFPVSTEGKTKADKENNYSRQIKLEIEKTYPSHALGYPLLANNQITLENKALIGKLLTDDSSFDINTKSIHRYVEEDPDGVFGQLDEVEKISFRKEAQKLQRLHKVSPEENRAEVTLALEAGGYKSSKDISKETETDFVRRASGGLGSEDTAITVHFNAGVISGFTDIVTLNLRDAYGHLFPVWDGITSAAPEEPELGELRELFGSLNYCACRHCRSVLSPAAYMVDTLQFLEKIESIDRTSNALQSLLQDRPDIEYIELSCENTNTVLPYIDLVNEVLENAVTELTAGTHLQTIGTAEDLRANPEYINVTAYNKLKDEKYPWSLPFNLWVEESNIYLQHLGVAKHQLMSSFRTDDSTISNFEIAAEYLGLLPFNRDVVIASTSTEGARDYGKLWRNVDSMPTWSRNMREMSNILEHSGLNLETLEELLDVDYLYQEGTTERLELNFDAANCDLADLRVIGLGVSDTDPQYKNSLERLLRFARLQQATDWTVQEQDTIFRALNITWNSTRDNLDQDAIVRLSHVKHLLTTLGTDILEIANWWRNTIDTKRQPEEGSTYETLFLDKTLNDPTFQPDEEDNPFRLNAVLSELEAAGPDINVYASTIQTVLETNAGDLSKLINRLLDPGFNLENLSTLFKHRSLARALDITIEDYLALYDLYYGPISLSDSGLFLNPENTTTFVNIAIQISESGISISQLNYLLSHRFDPDANFVLSDDDVIRALTTLQAELVNLVSPFEDSGEYSVVRENVVLGLGQILPADKIQSAIAVIAGITGLPKPEQESFIVDNFSAFIEDIDGAKTELGSDSVVDEIGHPARFEYVLGAIIQYLRKLEKITTIKHFLAESMGLEEAILSLLLDKLPTADITATASDDLSVLDDFLVLVAEGGGPHPTVTSALHSYNSYLLLHKINLLRQQFDLDHDQLKIILSESNNIGWLNIADLPLSESIGPSRFVSWLNLLKAVEMDKKTKVQEFSLFSLWLKLHDVDSPLSQDNYLTHLERGMQWSRSDLEFLVSSSGFNWTYPDHFNLTNSISAVEQLYNTLSLISRIGVTAEQAWQWANDSIENEYAQSLKETVKSQYDDQQWRTIITPLRDELRERQRDALVAYLEANGVPIGDGTLHHFEDAKTIYAKYLIDPLMSSCMLTSRIKQANSSIQLFVQRCLLNLVPEIELTEAHKNQWEWMKNYRVWEASRKVFLYAENWVEFDLLDRESPFFKDMKSTLLQNEVTAETVEDAYINYLEKLDEVARLEVMGHYQEEREEDGGYKVLHVFARTENEPHIYYYRRWENESYWTAWEKVDLDIQGEHIIPVVWNRRLYVFWAMFTEKAEETGEVSEEESGTSPSKYWVVQLNWSEYKRGKWVAKKQTVFQRTHRSSAPENITFKVHSGDSLIFFMFSMGRFLSDYSMFRFNSCSFSNEFNNNLWVVLRELISDLSNPSKLNLGFLPLGTEDYKMKFIDSEILERDELNLNISAFESGDNIDGVFSNIPKSLRILKNGLAGFELSFPAQHWHPTSNLPIFYKDRENVFLINKKRWSVKLLHLDGTISLNDGHRFEKFDHPYVCHFIEQTHQNGIDGLLAPQSGELRYQLKQDYYFGIEAAELDSENKYEPTLFVPRPYPKNKIDFSYSGAYSQYNWELFFLAPMMIACKLSQEQKFAEAHKWVNYVFDPTDLSRDGDGDLLPSPARFWKIKPFHQPEDLDIDREGRPWSIQVLLKLLAYEGELSPELRETRDDMLDQVIEWRKDPFNPHKIARMRTPVYMRTTVMKYLDNLIAWGDQLFRRDSIESINEATQLYILVANIIGPRPVQLPERDVAIRTYSEIKEHLDEFSNTVVENLVPDVPAGTVISTTDSAPIPDLGNLYFCVPPNDKLFEYWDRVEDRLFKIRHCMNIGGQVRQLPLFEPPIDPALLVRARAAGVDIGSVLNDLNAPLPHYRFQVLIQKAIDLCADVRSLGAALLSALEKKDAESIALLRSRQEIDLLKSIRFSKEMQIKETEKSKDSLVLSRKTINLRESHYTKLINKGLISQEKAHSAFLVASTVAQAIAQISPLAASTASSIPDFYAGGAGWSSPVAITKLAGGSKVAASLNSFGSFMQIYGSIFSLAGTLSSISASQKRRGQEWGLQKDVAENEIIQTDRQIEAASIRLQIAEKDLENHEKQIENAEEVNDFMNGKFTNKELYNWMITQVSTLYFQSYQLAYDLVRRAERAYQRELGLSETNFVQFGHWDSLKKGLLCGEKLHFELKQMSSSYDEQNKREFELTKHISLAMLNPVELVRLKETGECDVILPETLFDLDTPGHYMRRIKSVSLTLPCVTGPYTSVNCKLSLHKSEVRTKPDISTSEHLVSEYGAIQSVVTSNAQNDSGLFEVNFRDERYLPFEYAGVISTWHLTLPDNFKQFDYDSISDVVMHMRYTARDGGDPFKQDVEDKLANELKAAIELGEKNNGIGILLSVKSEFSNAWHSFLHPESDQSEHILEVDFNQGVPYFLRNEIKIANMHVYFIPEDKDFYQGSSPNWDAALPFQLKDTGDRDVAGSDLGFNLVGVKLPPNKSIKVDKEPDMWKIIISGIKNPPGTDLPIPDLWMEVLGHDNYKHLNPEAIDDIVIAIDYKLK